MWNGSPLQMEKKFDLKVPVWVWDGDHDKRRANESLIKQVG
jgi:hypothetical protein